MGRRDGPANTAISQDDTYPVPTSICHAMMLAALPRQAKGERRPPLHELRSRNSRVASERRFAEREFGAREWWAAHQLAATADRLLTWARRVRRGFSIQIHVDALSVLDGQLLLGWISIAAGPG